MFRQSEVRRESTIVHWLSLRSIDSSVFSEMRINVLDCRLFEEHLAAVKADQISLPRGRLQTDTVVVFGWNSIEELRTFVAWQNCQTAFGHRLKIT